jgi:hypothetical protein
MEIKNWNPVIFRAVEKLRPVLANWMPDRSGVWPEKPEAECMSLLARSKKRLVVEVEDNPLPSFPPLVTGRFLLLDARLAAIAFPPAEDRENMVVVTDAFGLRAIHRVATGCLPWKQRVAEKIRAMCGQAYAFLFAPAQNVPILPPEDNW